MRKIVILLIAILLISAIPVYYFIAQSDQSYTIIGIWDVGENILIKFDKYERFGDLLSDQTPVLSYFGTYREEKQTNTLTMDATLQGFGEIVSATFVYKMQYLDFGQTLILEEKNTGDIEIWHRR